MCALAPFPTPNWPLLNPIGHELNYIFQPNQTIDSSLQFSPQPIFQPNQTIDSSLQFSPQPIFQPNQTIDSSLQFSPQPTFDPCAVKKLNHNTSERDRRKKVNTLYSSLRSILPVADQMKKLSFPATVSHALKYIPELQAQVERLVHKKEELLSKASQQCGIEGSSDGDDQLRKTRDASVSINRLSSDSEIAIHISMQKNKVQNTQLSKILHLLEQQGFLLLNATSFESFGGIIFYNIHLQVESEIPYQLTESDTRALSEQLLGLCHHG